MRSGVPTRAEAIWLSARRVGLRVLRRVRERVLRTGVDAAPHGDALAHAPIVAEASAPLWTTTSPEEWPLVAGKVENLRVAARALHGIELPAGRPFSFWAQVGRPSARRGFVLGREVRHGCVVPTIAGGICQLSNLLHAAARQAGVEILERHAHSQGVAPPGADATVLWSYLDLRLRAPFALRVEVELSADALVVRLRGHAPRTSSGPQLVALPHAPVASRRSCLSCDEADCTARPRLRRLPREGMRAFVLDGVTPELDRWVRTEAAGSDVALVPIDGARWHRPRYAWSTAGFARVQQAPALALRRAIASRRLAAEGAARQRALLDLDAELATALARAIPMEATHLVVAQTLLPHLQRAGVLGGRTFDVLATRPSLAHLHATLDRAAACHPESRTLADFRADPWLVEAEAHALARADRIVSPHAELAAAFGDRAVRVPWVVPPSRPRPARAPGAPLSVWFPASTLARKGCRELLHATADLPIRVHAPDRVLEAPGFWAGRDVVLGPVDPRAVDLVVLPAWVEPAPRVLLSAIATGLPVVASTACGLADVPGVEEVATGDAEALRAVLARHAISSAEPAVTRASRR
jgi:hypothetical protein